MNDLFLLLERQVQFVRKQEGHRLLMALPALVDFVQREPRLRRIADAVVREFDEAVAGYQDADKRCTADVLELFEKNATWTGPIYAHLGEMAVEDPLSVPRDHLLKCAKESGSQVGDPLHFIKADSSRADSAISRLSSFLGQIESSSDLGGSESRHRDMVRRLGEISWDHQRAHFRFVHTMCASAGASWRILTDLSDGICPEVPSTTQDDGWYEACLKADNFKKRIAKAYTLLGINRSGEALVECERLRAMADQALEIFLQETALRIGTYLSHRALIMRFKTKCERFLADDLREHMIHDSSRAESHAAHAAAHFLFDQGLDPLFNAQIVRLRPDLWDPNLPHPLYVEAKQYGKGSPRAMIQKAIWQVWDTWRELDANRKVREAFLLVFRTGGPLVVFEDSAHLEGRTLHPILVDIAPSDERGSSTKEKPISFTAADLLPQPGDPT